MKVPTTNRKWRQLHHNQPYSRTRTKWRMALFALIALILVGCGARNATTEPTIANETTPAVLATQPAPTPEVEDTQKEEPAAADAEAAADNEDSDTNEADVAEGQAVAEATAIGENATESVAAFVRSGILMLQNGADADSAIVVEDCSLDRCFINHLKWSPSGTHLLYYVGSYDGSVPHQYRIVDRTGTIQTLTEAAAYVQPAGWAPDGSALAYRVDTDRYQEGGDGAAQRIHELWTVGLTADGTLGDAVLHGEITFGEGCGGGGRSESANVYEREGGFAYGYLSGVMQWTPGGILLYTDNCTTRGVSRFDLIAGAPLEPLSNSLRSLAVNAAGDQWVAINDLGQIVVGTPSSVETTVVPSSGVPEMVFFGKRTGSIYYTMLEVTDRVDLVEEASTWMDQSIAIFPAFDTTIASIVAIDPANPTETETVLYADDPVAYAYANVREATAGGITFARVESNAELQAAVENETLTADNWREYMPTVDIMTLGPGGEAYLLLANAAQYTPAP